MESIRVFIVEDDPMVASINKRFTEKVAPFQVIRTSTTEEDALIQIEGLNPDLVLLDIFLPGGSGLSLLKQIRHKSLPTDIILITAAKDAPTIYQTLRYGAVDYIIKPFDLERLQHALRNYAKLRQLMHKNLELTQADLDKLNGSGNNDNSSLPKGVHLLTLDQIISFLLRQNKALSCEQLASALSMSKITIWRYLEYLCDEGKVKVELEYGTVGRPTKLYRITQKP